MNSADATRLAGDAYSTRLARDVRSTSDDKTRLAQEGYQSRLARDAVGAQPDASEFYKVGEKIGGRYEVSAIHYGAMGVVYGCFDHETKLPRALKTVRARYAHDRQVLSMFEAEATVWISLEKHPYIVRAYLVERFKNLPYVITEYVRGPEGMEGDLRGWLGHPRLTLSVAVTMALQIAQGMQHVVRKVPNLVHRDLKPANILVNGDGKAMVTDFGLVHAAQSGAGTPAYMSPEQWRNEALDARSDIYAYGCILFEMLTARRLFPAVSANEWERAHLESDPAALIGLVSELPGEIDRFVRRCLEKNAGSRPQSWDEVVAFFAEWYHRLTGNSVVLDFSSLALDIAELVAASYSLGNVKRWQEMLFTSERALAIDGGISALWVNKGVALAGLNRREEALSYYDRAIEIDSKNTAAWTSRSAALLELNRDEEALSACDSALAIDEYDARVWSNKGMALKRLRRFSEAVQAYDRALAIEQFDARMWSNNGNVLRELKRHDEAIQAYDRALAINPNSSAAYHNKGCALYDLQRYGESIEVSELALRLDPKRFEAWHNIGAAYAQIGRYEEAIRALDQGIANDPSAAPSWSNKGYALAQLGRYEDAIKAYDQALAIMPGLATAQNLRNTARQKLKEGGATMTKQKPKSFWEGLWGRR